MDWKLFATAFASIFLAELGDKTQLATLGLAGATPGYSQKLVIFIGASLALIATTAIGVVAGELVGRVVEPHWLKRGAGLVFLVLGAVYVRESFQPR